MKKILIINGPNLNMLGRRPKEHYGALTLNEINEKINEANASYFELDFFQSNCEGEIVSKLQECLDYFGIIINPAAYTHTSVAIRDALEMVSGHIIEVHLSAVDSREDFRKINYVRDIVEACYSGKHYQSYIDALEYLKNLDN